MSARFPGIALVSAALLFLSTSPARANAVLTPADEAAAAELDVELAVAGGARWMRVRANGPSRVMWLVPARPGAAIDWAPDAWLDALDDATAPRIVPPDTTPPCSMRATPERAATYGATGTGTLASDVTVLETESEARAHAAAAGFAVSPALATRIAAVYATGRVLVSVEPSAMPTRTLRVIDGAPASLPLVLTGTQGGLTRVTAFVIASGPAEVASTADLAPEQLTWGRSGSSWNAQRDALVQSGLWIRESSTHAALFDGFRTPRVAVDAALDVYFRVTNTYAAGCTSAARAVATATGVVGTTCAPGAAALVPGGAACVPSTGDVDPSALTCGSSIDAALALAGIAPKTATVTRLAGGIGRSAFGADLAIGKGPWELSPMRTAPAYDQSCNVNVVPTSPGGGGTAATDDPPADPGPNIVVVTSESCSGDTTSTTTDEPDGTEQTTTSSSGCSGDTTTTSTSSDSGSKDDSSSCSGDSSSSKKSDDSEGWDKKDDSSSKDSCGSSSSDAGAKSAKRKTSKVSRYAMLLVFFVLPLRRRLRKL